jgi:glyoxylase I family protein
MAPNASSTELASVRYLVKDLDRSLAFYTGHLGFAVESRVGGAFAAVTRGGLRLILSGPGASGSRTLPDGRTQEPGGYNRIILYVEQLDPVIAQLRGAGAKFRNEVESGPGGKQIQLEDPDGNPIELHQP